MKGMTIERMAQACGAQVIGGQPQDRNKTAAAIVTDSRQVTEGSVFVALPGERVDGHDFIPQVFAAGALAVVCERVPQPDPSCCQFRIIGYVSGRCVITRCAAAACSMLSG